MSDKFLKNYREFGGIDFAREKYPLYHKMYVCSRASYNAGFEQAWLKYDEVYGDWEQRLFTHLSEQHDLILTNEEMADIYRTIIKFDIEKENARLK